jgi:uncharacterized protein YdaU (DUF1376 family)
MKEGWILLHSYPWYIADWRESETRQKLSLAERGLYRELLDYCYAEGNLPANRKLLGSIAGATGKQLRYNLEAVLKLFDLKETANGPRYFHKKVDEVRSKLLNYHQKQAHAGVLSGQARRERTLNGGSNGKRTNVEPSTTPTTTPTNTPLTPHAPNGAGVLNFPGKQKHPRAKKTRRSLEEIRQALGPERLPWWDGFWSVFPCHAGIAPGMEVFERLVHTRELAAEIFHGAKAYAAKYAADPEMKLKYPQGWLNDERWKDEVDTEPVQKSIYTAVS